MPNIRVLLADDHAVLREGLAVLINAQSDMQVVAHASDGASALQQTQDWQPDVAVMDLSMPGMSVLEAIKAMRREQVMVQVVVLTRHTEVGYVRQVFQVGARGYVLKQSAATELFDAIRVVASGATYLESALAVSIAQQFGDSVTQQGAHPITALSERESAVVRLLAHGHSNKEIATEFGLSVKTIDTYKIRAMDKLGLYGRAALVRYALQQGWFDSDI